MHTKVTSTYFAIKHNNLFAIHIDKLIEFAVFDAEFFLCLAFSSPNQSFLGDFSFISESEKKQPNTTWKHISN